LIEKIRIKPAYWAIILFILALIITLSIVSRMDNFLETNDIYIPPQSPPETISFWPQPPPATTTPGVVVEPPAPFWTSLGPILIYIFSVVLVLSIVLYFIPLKVLKKVLRIVFSLLFSWGVFIALVFWTPLAAAITISALVGLIWFFTPRIWLHNIAMLLAMASLGAVFGRMIPPWTAMILLLIIALYDFFAVRFGYMLWLATKLSESTTLPAFFIPRFVSEWKGNLNGKSISGLAKIQPDDRDFSILGGGDIGFPVLLISSVYFAYGLTDAILVAAFSLAGIIGAYWIQAFFLKGKPMPALPPIAALSLIGLLTVSQLLN
jgi:presenilin-like A22 family membrane protease